MEYTEMKDRIAHIIRAKNLTAAEFALRLGIQPSNVSHILAGRNNPSLEFVKKLKETFPEYNFDWIIMGKGPMTVSEPIMESKTVSGVPESTKTELGTELDTMEGTLFAPETKMSPVSETPSPLTSGHNLKQIILVYEDHSFDILSPR